MRDVLNLNKNTTQDNIKQFFKNHGIEITHFAPKYEINYDYTINPRITIEYRVSNNDMLCRMTLFDIKIDGTETFEYNNGLIVKTKTDQQDYTYETMVEHIMEDVGA